MKLYEDRQSYASDASLKGRAPVKNLVSGTGKEAQQSKALDVLLEDLGLNPSTYMAALKLL